MISRGYLQGFDRNGATDIYSYVFQPLTPGLGDSTQPIVLPVANRTWISDPDECGGRWKLNANLLTIIPEVGTQTRRLSLGSACDRTFPDAIRGRHHKSSAPRRDSPSSTTLHPHTTPL